MDRDLLKKVRVLPENFGPLRGADGNVRMTGPCGDTMEFWISVVDGRLRRVMYTTDGCGHSALCGSIAASLAEDRTLDDALRLKQQDVLDRAGDLPEENRHCALLAVTVLQATIDDYRYHQAAKRRD